LSPRDSDRASLAGTGRACVSTSRGCSRGGEVAECFCREVHGLGQNEPEQAWLTRPVRKCQSPVAPIRRKANISTEKRLALRRV
jgi:hypothetical protein